MKFKRLIIGGIVVVLAAYLTLAYSFMWPPMVLYYWNWHKSERSDVVFCWPSERNRSSANACVNTLRQLDSAIDLYALEHNKKVGDPVTFADLTPYMRLDNHGQIPPCPAGGVYSVSVVGAPPVCSYSTNSVIKFRVDNFFYDFKGPYPNTHKLP